MLFWEPQQKYNSMGSKIHCITLRHTLNDHDYDLQYMNLSFNLLVIHSIDCPLIKFMSNTYPSVNKIEFQPWILHVLDILYPSQYTIWGKTSSNWYVMWMSMPVDPIYIPFLRFPCELVETWNEYLPRITISSLVTSLSSITNNGHVTKVNNMVSGHPWQIDIARAISSVALLKI